MTPIPINKHALIGDVTACEVLTQYPGGGRHE